MRRLTAVFVAFLVSVCGGAAAAQDFSGSYAAAGGAGATLTLVLRQNAQGQVTGTLSGNTQFQIQARVQNGQLAGYASAQGGRLYLEGQLQGTEALLLGLAEVGPDGQPQVQTARTVMLARTAGAGSGGPAMGAPAMGAPGARAAGPGPRGQAGGMGAGVAASGQDGQIAQLLLSGAWCYFSYSQTSGTTHTERVVFRGDGTGAQSTGGETYNSGANGTVAGQSQGGQPFRWRVQGGMLVVAGQDGQASQVPLVITRNSSGSPIVTAGGKEYARCN